MIGACVPRSGSASCNERVKRSAEVRRHDGAGRMPRTRPREYITILGHRIGDILGLCVIRKHVLLYDVVVGIITDVSNGAQETYWNSSTRCSKLQWRGALSACALPRACAATKHEVSFILSVKNVSSIMFHWRYENMTFSRLVRTRPPMSRRRTARHCTWLHTIGKACV